MMIKKLLFLGPKGSYSDLAKNNFLDFISPDCEFIPEDSIYSIFNVLSTNSIPNTTAKPDKIPMIAAEVGDTVSQPAVIATRPAKLPFNDMETSGFL